MTLSLKEFGDGELTTERGKEFHNGTMLIKKMICGQVYVQRV